MAVHKKIFGGEIYLPFALKKLRTLAADAQKRGGYAATTIIAGDGTKISLSVMGSEHFLTINGGGAGSYEFFTSEVVLQETFGTPGAPTAGGKPVALGSGTRHLFVRDGAKDTVKKSAKPLFSNVFEPSENDKWWMPDSPILNFSHGDESIIDNPKFFQAWASWQQQKTNEYAWWLNNEPYGYVTSTKSLGKGRLNQASLFGRTTCYTYDWTLSDSGFDVPPAYYDVTGAYVGAPLLEDNVWWRRAAVQEVAIEGGGKRKFFVMSDTHGRFHVYPVRAYQNEFPDDGYLFLPSEMFKTATPPYPAWVTLPEIGTEAIGKEFVWEFNKDATKAVSIPFNSIDGTVDIKAEWITAWEDHGGATENPWPSGAGTHAFKKGVHLFYNPNKLFFETDGPFKIPAVGTLYSGRTDVPGLVEIGIEIVLTGEGEMDYDVVLTLIQSDYYADSGRYYVDAGYLLKNERLGITADDALGAAEDALITAEIEVWSGEGIPAFDSGYGGTIYPFYVVMDRSASSRLRRIYLGQINRPYVSGFVDFFGSSPSLDFANDGMVAPWVGLNSPRTFILSADLRSLSFVGQTLVSSYGAGVYVNHPQTHVWNEPIGFPWPYPFDAAAFAATGLPLESDFSSIVSYESTYVGFNPERDYLADCTMANDLKADLLAAHGVYKMPGAPLDLLDIMQSVHQGFITPDLGGYVMAHPQGHWASTGAASPDVDRALDIIQTYKQSKTNGAWKANKPQKHSDLFNKAFKQDRLASFYEPRHDDYTEQSGLTGTYRGAFCTTGVWTIVEKKKKETP